MTKIINKKSSLFLLFVLIYFLNSLFSIKVYVPLTLESPWENSINFSELYICESANNCLNPNIQAIKVYDYDKVSNCFQEYNTENIDSCIVTGLLNENNIFLPANTKKRFVIEATVPDQNNYHIYFFVFPKEGFPFLVYYKRDFINITNLQYINEVYYYLNGYLDYNYYLIQKLDLQNRGLIIGNFSIQNEVEKSLPLLINLPIGVDAAICSEVQMKIKDQFSNYYFPVEYIDYFNKIRTDVILTVISNETKDIYLTKKKTLIIDARVCEINYEEILTISDVGHYEIKIEAIINDSKFINGKNDSISSFVKVFDSQSQFCYTNIANFEIKSNNSYLLTNNNNITVSFEILSGENDGTGLILPKPSFWTLKINNSVVAYGTTESSLEYKKVSLNLGKLSPGNYVLSLEGIALNCSFQNNEKRVITKTIEIINLTSNNISNNVNNDTTINETNNQTIDNNKTIINYLNITKVHFYYDDINNNNLLDINETVYFQVELISNIDFRLDFIISLNENIIKRESITETNKTGNFTYTFSFIPKTKGNYFATFYAEALDYSLASYKIIEFQVFDTTINETNNQTSTEDKKIDSGPEIEEDIEETPFEYYYIKRESSAEKSEEESLYLKYKDLILEDIKKKDSEKKEKIEKKETVFFEEETQYYPIKKKNNYHLYLILIIELLLILTLSLIMIKRRFNQS